MITNKKDCTTKTVLKSNTRRRTIGFVESSLKDNNTCSVWQGIIDSSRDKDMNVISFFPHDLETTNGFDAQANVLYDLINSDHLDGLIIWTSGMTIFAGMEGSKRIFERFRSIPIICIEKGGLEHIPFLEIDSYRSMREAVTHLIREHGHHRIAFIRGPADHAGACERYQGYLDVLAEYDIPFDPDLVSPPTDGSWKQEVGEEAIALLLDRRHASFDSVIGVCDNIAIGAMRALDARGINIPDQIAVVGFDDDTGSNSTIPPLTTMSLRGYEQGRQAIQMLIKLMDGGEIPAKSIVSPQIIIRQSCGCFDPAVMEAAAGQINASGETLESFKTDQREKTLSEMKLAAGMTMLDIDSGWADEMLETFFVELKAGKSGSFLYALNNILRKVILAEDRVELWSNVLSALRRCTLPYLGNSKLLLQAEDLWLQAQVMVGESARKAMRYHASKLDEQKQILNKIRADLISTFDMNDLMDTLARELPRLGISGCYLSLYENPKQPAGLSQLVLAYDTMRGRLDLKYEKKLFPSTHLVPEDILPDRRYSMVTEALYFRDEQLGFVMFESGPREGSIYDLLREEISSALQGARLVQRVQERSAELTRQQYILDSFMDNIPHYIYFKDTQSRMTRANRALAVKMGVKDPCELIGKSDFDFYPLDHAQRMYQQEQELIKSGKPILGLEETDGMNHWMTTKMPLLDENGIIIGTFGISTDITELVKAKQSLENRADEIEKAYETLASERNLMLTLINNLPDHIYVKDVEGRFILSNVSLAQHMGAANPDDLIGKNDFDFYPLDLAEKFYADEQSLIRSNQSLLDHEEATRDQYNQIKWVLTTKVLLRDSQGQNIGLVGIGRDITERKLAEAEREHLLAELKRQQYILDAFMDNIPNYIYFKDIQSRMTRANRSLAVKMGVKDPCELIGKSDFDFYPLENAQKMYQQEQDLIKTGKPILGLEETDGMNHWMTTKMPLLDENGIIIGTFGISTDITELVKAKQSLENRASELEQAYKTLQKQQQMLLITEKAASLGRLTAGLAHEMNTPLAAIRASLVESEKLVKEYKASIGNVNVTVEDHNEIARELYQTVQLAKKSAEVVSGFLRGIKSQTLNPSSREFQQINSVAAIEDVLLLLNHSLKEGKCDLKFEKPVDPIYLSGIPGRLEQVVTNLVNNAIDASYPQGGLITISLKNNQGFVELQVADHGSGILPENLSKIFDPMFSTKPFGLSTGLGLTIVHDIIAGEFGGLIDVTSTPGKGTTFSVRIPLK